MEAVIEPPAPKKVRKPRKAKEAKAPIFKIVSGTFVISFE